MLDEFLLSNEIENEDETVDFEDVEGAPSESSLDSSDEGMNVFLFFVKVFKFFLEVYIDYLSDEEIESNKKFVKWYNKINENIDTAKSDLYTMIVHENKDEGLNLEKPVLVTKVEESLEGFEETKGFVNLFSFIIPSLY